MNAEKLDEWEDDLPHESSERYLDDEDCHAFAPLDAVVDQLKYRDVTVAETLQALEILCTHLRKKYYVWDAGAYEYDAGLILLSPPSSESGMEPREFKEDD